MPQDPETARSLSLVHGQVCYLQLPAADRNRAAAFYQAVFGWQAEVHHPDWDSASGGTLAGKTPAHSVVTV
jgi:predicted enzyme related to lactoylglutathione lyase